ncbi:MAG: response regulator [Oligoflexales bacterium]
MSKILIVDDNQGTIDLIESCIVDLGTAIFKAKNGEIGWDTFQEVKPDLVITDYKMPGLDGYELALLIEKDSPDCPVILLTGYDDMDEKVKTHFTKIFEKPFPIRIFHFTIKQLLESKSTLTGCT